ncbi:GNAT family N-acetyltransferase [Rhodopseudomonas palustris]|uniref:GNAT family N-acetyltransferase n=1 Tax=Rhodopseudomonas palustris TaxID=1076 RepID=UPI001057EA7F|nr:GNAT family N-acetyltransferase [Rhodopseudomonas palustris]
MARIAAHFKLAVAGLSVRPMRPTDDAFCRGLSDEILRTEFDDMELPEPMLAGLLAQQFDARRIGYLRSFPDAEYFVISDRDVAVGRIVVAIEEAVAVSRDVARLEPGAARQCRDGQALRIIDIALLPAARGDGVGRAVIDGLASVAKQMNVGRLTLSVQSSNDRARRLYHRLGFVELGGEAYRQMTKPVD